MQESKDTMLQLVSTSNIAQFGIQEDVQKKNIKGLQAQQVVQEVYSKMEDLDERTNTKRKNRTVGLGSYEEEQFQDNNTLKGKSEGIRELPDKQAKFLKLAEVSQVVVGMTDWEGSDEQLQSSFSTGEKSLLFFFFFFFLNKYELDR